MANNTKKPRGRAPKDANPKKYKKKTSVLVTEKVEYVDYKDVNLLARFVSDRSKIRNRRVTGNDVQQQREVANAVKNAREMALLPYTKRVSQTRAPRSRDGDGRRGEQADTERSEARVEPTERTEAPVTDDGSTSEEA